MQILLAPAGRGKTAHILQRIRALLAGEPLAPIWVILPNQVQVMAFQRRLAGEGGALGVQVGAFYGLYGEVLARAGRPVPRLFDPVQHRLLRAAVDHLCQQGALRHYAPLRDKPGFLRLLRTLILELKRARVAPESFIAATAGEAPRLAELASIYALYQDWLVRTGWADAEGQGWLASLALEADPTLCSDVRLLAVDGFDEFNPTQLAVLRLLAGRAAETVVTLTGDFRPRLAHRRFERARQALQESVGGPDGLALILLDSAAPDLCGPLARLEAGLFEPGGERQPADGAITLIEAQNRAEEVRAALRWLKALIVRQGLTPGETAVLARNLEPYRPFLLETAGEFGLPLHVTAGALGQRLAANPAVTALVDLLALPANGWPWRGVLEAWRSPYFDWSSLLATVGGPFAEDGGAAEVAAALGEASRAARVTPGGGLEQWREALERLATRPLTGEPVDDEDRIAGDGLAGERALALRRAFDAFVSRLQPPRLGAISTYVAFVEDLIGDDPEAPDFAPPATANRRPARADGSLHMVAAARRAPATAERDVAALRAFKDVLAGLVLAEGITAAPPLSLAAGPIDYRRFLAELKGALEAAGFQPPDPALPGQAVLAAPLLHARGLSFKAVALLGLAEGDQAQQEDPLLRDNDRLALRQRGLPLQPRITGDEATFFYEAITRARQRLLLTRPYLTDDGQPWEPSPYWLEVQRLAAVEAEHRRPETALAWSEVASPQELLAAMAQRAGDLGATAQAAWPPGSQAAEAPSLPDFDLAGAWRHVLHAASVLRARLKPRAAGPYDGDLSALDGQLQADYAPEHVWSSSRLEAYAVCPFNFFVGSGLGLEPRLPMQTGFDQLILGSIYHAVLEQVYRQALELGDWSEQALLSLLPLVAEAVFDAAPQRYGFRPTPLWAYQRRELTQILERTLQGLAEAAVEGGYRPLALEQAFGLEGQPPLVIESGQGSLRLRGYIDRIDQGSDGRLRLVDYKSSAAPIQVSELDEGRRLQLPLYALAAEQALSLGQAAEADGFYWHIGSAQPSRLRLETYEGGAQAALAVAVQGALAHVRGIRSGRFEPRPPAAGCPRSCPAVGFCWRYRPQRG